MRVFVFLLSGPLPVHGVIWKGQNLSKMAKGQDKGEGAEVCLQQVLPKEKRAEMKLEALPTTLETLAESSDLKTLVDLAGGLVVKNPPANQYREHGFDPCSGDIS